MKNATRLELYKALCNGRRTAVEVGEMMGLNENTVRCAAARYGLTLKHSDGRKNPKPVYLISERQNTAVARFIMRKCAELRAQGLDGAAISDQLRPMIGGA